MILKKVNISYNQDTVLKNICFTLSNSDRVGLVGINGSGKSTLLKAIAGELPIDSGQINLENESCKLLKQEISRENYDLTILEYIKKETGIDKLEKDIKDLEDNFADDKMDLYGSLLDEYLSLDGYNFDENLSNILSGLNLRKPMNTKILTLSGGEKIKVLLAVVLMSNPDIYLLDEPTNNLDLDSIEFLENYLASKNKKMIIVSHDEEFLSRTVNKIFELSEGSISVYNLGYDAYMELKEIEYNHNLEEYERAQAKKDELKHRMNEVERWTSKGTDTKKKKDNDKLSSNYAKERTKKTSSKLSQLSKQIADIETTDFKKRQAVNFDISFDASKGNKSIILSDLVCGYDNFCIKSVKLDIPFQSRVCITGPNGSGKTTLIKTILGELSPISGEIKIGNSVVLGYIGQDTITIDKDYTVLEYLTHDFEEFDRGMLFTILDKFHIKYEDKDKPYMSLSPGERTKVNLAKLALNKINVLILDEITNHLDVETINAVTDIIKTFQGTIICISHNRRFIEALNPNMIYDITSGKLTHGLNQLKR